MSHNLKVSLCIRLLTPENMVVKCQSITDNMQASGRFPEESMPISYSAIQTTINNFAKAIVDKNIASGTDICFMHSQVNVLTNTFHIIKEHIEFIANNDSNPFMVIASTGLLISEI